MGKKVHLKARLGDHKGITDFMAKCKSWHVDALKEIGFEKWAMLKEDLFVEDLDLISFLLLNFNTRTGMLRIYGREYHVTVDDFKKYLALNDGTEREFSLSMNLAARKKESLVDDARKKDVGKDFLEEAKKGSGKPNMSGEKCLAKMNSFLKDEERPDDAKVLEFQLSFFWTLDVDVLFTTAGRFGSLNLLALKSAEQVRETDWATHGWDYMMERIDSWQRKADRWLSVPEEGDDDSNSGKGAGKKRFLIPGGHTKPRKSKKMSESHGPSKVAGKTTAASSASATAAADDDSDDDEEGGEDEENEGGEEGADEDHEDGDDDGEGSSKKGQKGRYHCGGFILFFQLFYYEHLKLSQTQGVPEAEFPLARWTEANASLVNKKIQRGVKRKHVKHPQVLLEGTGRVVEDGEPPVRKFFTFEKIGKQVMAGADEMDNKLLAEVQKSCQAEHSEIKMNLKTLQHLVDAMKEKQDSTRDVTAGPSSSPAPPKGKQAAAKWKPTADDKAGIERLVKSLLEVKLKNEFSAQKALLDDAVKKVDEARRNATGDKKERNSAMKAMVNQCMDVKAREIVSGLRSELKSEFEEGHKALKRSVDALERLMAGLDLNDVEDLKRKTSSLEARVQLFDNRWSIVESRLNVSHPGMSHSRRLAQEIAEVGVFVIDVSALQEAPRLQRASLYWPEINWEDSLLKSLFYYLYEIDSRDPGWESLMPANADPDHMLYPMDLLSVGATNEMASQPIDIVGYLAVNRKREADSDPYYICLGFIGQVNLHFKKRKSKAENTEFAQNFLRAFWKLMVRPSVIYLPIHLEGHFFLCVVNHEEKIVEIWDTLSNNRDGHQAHVKKIMGWLAPLFDSLAEGEDAQRNWCKYSIVNIATYPEQENGKNDCGAWVCWFLLENLDSWRCWRSKHPILSSQMLRFRVACEVLRRDMWDEDQWKNLVTAALKWAVEKDEALSAGEDAASKVNTIVQAVNEEHGHEEVEEHANEEEVRPDGEGSGTGSDAEVA